MDKSNRTFRMYLRSNIYKICRICNDLRVDPGSLERELERSVTQLRGANPVAGLAESSASAEIKSERTAAQPQGADAVSGADPVEQELELAVAQRRDGGQSAGSRFCHNCGESVIAGDKFCSSCGISLEVA